jgi:histidinol phosphatase-like enzyme
MVTIRSHSVALMATGLAVSMLLVLLALPASAQKGQKPSPNTIKEVLAQYQGKATNIGTVRKIMNDYFLIEQDGATTAYALAALHSIRTYKEEDDSELKIEIYLTDKE